MFFRFCDVMIFFSDKCSVSLGCTERNEELVCSLDAHMPALSRIMLFYVCFFFLGGGQGDPTKHEANVKLQEEVSAEVGRCLDFELRLLLAPASELTDNMMET